LVDALRLAKGLEPKMWHYIDELKWE
jgi:hypothetical protein